MAENKKLNWPIILTALLIAYALLADWVSKNPVIGWTVIILVTLLAVFALVRFSTLRTKLFRAAKDSLYISNNKNQTKTRVPIPKKVKVACFRRASNTCENPNCGIVHGLEIHHINGDPSDNRHKNLAVLCRNCHHHAHNHNPPRYVVEDWVRENYNRRIKYKRY